MASGGRTTSPGLRSMVGDIYSMWIIAYDKFAKIDPKDTVDKLNKSKLTGKRKRKHDGAAVG